MATSRPKTSTAINKELTEENKALQTKLNSARAKNDNLLQAVSGLRIFVMQNNVETKDVLRLLERIIHEA